MRDFWFLDFIQLTISDSKRQNRFDVQRNGLTGFRPDGFTRLNGHVNKHRNVQNSAFPKSSLIFEQELLAIKV